MHASLLAVPPTAFDIAVYGRSPDSRVTAAFPLPYFSWSTRDYHLPAGIQSGEEGFSPKLALLLGGIVAELELEPATGL